MPEIDTNKKKNILKTIGPGLLFASSAIGTSHLVLSTRAGAHHGMIYFGIILLTLLLKYPFYEFGTRYSIATKRTLISGYRAQGILPLLLFFCVITVNMFAVNGAIGAVCAGLLSTTFGLEVSVHFLAAVVLGITVAILFIGSYSVLDNLIKLLSFILLVTISIAFVAVLIKGPVDKVAEVPSSSIFEGAGLALLVGLVGWMPAGMSASTMNSIWVVEKMKSTKYYPTLKEGLFDFNLGYIFTTILAIMFLTIGAYTVYGSGQLLEGNTTQFSKQLLEVFTINLGQWSYWIIAIAAFGTIYGTLITVMDAFTRSFIICLEELIGRSKTDVDRNNRLKRNYKILLPILGVGSFSLFYFSASSMIKIIEFATILGFVTSPIIAFLNLRAIRSDAVPEHLRPKPLLTYLSYIGLLAIGLFALFYLYTLLWD